MKIRVNDASFEMPWELSTTFDGWAELRAWFDQAIDEGYEYDDEGEVSAYPVVRVDLDLPQQIVIGICYGANMQFGDVNADGSWCALWYCAPLHKKFYKFLDSARIAEHNCGFERGRFSVGSGKFIEKAP